MRKKISCTSKGSMGVERFLSWLLVRLGEYRHRSRVSTLRNQWRCWSSHEHLASREMNDGVGLIRKAKDENTWKLVE